MALIDPAHQPRLLMPAKVKVALLAGLHPDELIVLPFTAELAGQSADEFCRSIVADTLHARVVVVGVNFTFGAGGAGTAQTLEREGATLGFRTIALPLATAGGRAISSTRIRRLLQTGALEEVREILGRPPSTHGSVVAGLRRGRTLGVPTANLEVEAGTIFPGRGVYAARAWWTGAGIGRPSTWVTTRPSIAAPKRLSWYTSRRSCSTSTATSTVTRSGWTSCTRSRRGSLRRRPEPRRQMQNDIRMAAELPDPAFAEVGLS